jgi:hypothetical protein
MEGLALTFSILLGLGIVMIVITLIDNARRRQRNQVHK